MQIDRSRIPHQLYYCNMVVAVDLQATSRALLAYADNNKFKAPIINYCLIMIFFRS